MYSPLQDVLHTNASPSDAEREGIRHLLEGPQAELADLTEEIFRLQLLIDDASRKRSQLKQFIDAHLALLSPARRLPDDIVREIFLVSLPSRRNPTISVDEAPHLLCQICRSWRFIALMTPRLWARIHIVVPPQARIPRLTELVAAWLSRSGSLPLKISMVFSRISETTCDVAPLLSVLMAVSRRWQDMQVTTPICGPGFPLESLSIEDVPMLQTMAITSDREPLQFGVGAPAPALAKLMFLAATRLQSISLPASTVLLHSPITWGRLKHLMIARHRGDRLTYDCARQILAQCMTLETCDLTISGRAEGGSVANHSTTNPPVSLPRLSHLSIKHENFTATGPGFFSHLMLPALRSFDCRSDASPPRGLDLILPRFFPSTISLTCLRVAIRALTSDFVLAALATMPSLEELYILGGPCRPTYEEDPDFVARLTPDVDSPDPVLCPLLRHVELLQFRALSDETLVAFVRGRTGPQRPADVGSLSSVKFGLQRHAQFDVMPHLKDAVAGGLEMDIKYNAFPPRRYSPLEGTERHHNNPGWVWNFN